MGYTIIASKKSVDGRQIFLGKAENGDQALLEALNLAISGHEVALLRELRKAIQALPPPQAAPGRVGRIVMYQELLKIEGDFYLRLPYDERIWTNWENNGVYGLSPQKVVAAAETMLGALDELEYQGGLDYVGFSPQDLVLLGPEEWVVFDPRVRALLVSYRIEDKSRRHFFPPEVIKGGGWVESSNIYTIGLTLYLLGTGVFPYPLDGEEKTITAIIREKPLDPRYYRPEISESLSCFILATLNKKPGERFDLTRALEIIGRIKEEGGRATPEEEARLREEAEAKLRQVEQKRRAYWWWQRMKLPVLVGAVVLVFLFAATRGGQEIITPQTTPEEVVRYFYEAISELDDSKLQETLAKEAKQAGAKEFDNLVVNLSVLHKMRFAYEGIKIPTLIVDSLKLTKQPAVAAENPVFFGEYTLKILEGPDHYLLQDRKDRIVLGRVKNEWRIISMESRVVAEGKEAITREP